VRDEGGEGGGRKTGLQAQGGRGGRREVEGGGRQDAHGHAGMDDDTAEEVLSLSTWREALKLAPLHPCELSPGDSISVGESDYTVERVDHTNMRVEVSLCGTIIEENGVIPAFGFHELLRNCTCSTKSVRGEGWGEDDMKVGESTTLNISPLGFTRILLLSGLHLSPEIQDVRSKKEQMSCLDS